MTQLNFAFKDNTSIGSDPIALAQFPLLLPCFSPAI
jgi:hypothetical protein